MDPLVVWREGPMTLAEAVERYGEVPVGEGLLNGLLKLLPTRMGFVLVPGAKGRLAMGMSRHYTPRPSTMEDGVAVRRQVEALQRKGYRVLWRTLRRALLEREGERVLVVSGLNRRGSRMGYQGAERVVLLVPEGGTGPRQRKKVEYVEVCLGRSPGHEGPAGNAGAA